MTNSFEPMTVLITGSEGNIGQYLVKSLKRHFPSWTVLRVKNSSSNPSYNSDLHRYEGDLRNPALLDLIFSQNKVDYVVHAASMSYRHGGYNQFPFDVLENDIRVTMNLLQACQKSNQALKKLVYLSSALIYENATQFPLLEEMTQTIPPPRSSYGFAKYVSESILERFQKQFGTSYTVWRLFNVVSPLEPHLGEGRHVFVDFYRKLIVEKTPKLEIFGSGQQVRCFIWVEEAADCMIQFLEDPRTDGQIFNLTRDEPRTLIELKEILIELGKSKNLLERNYQPEVITGGTFAGVDTEKRIPSVKKLKDRLGWESQVDFRSCFDRFIDFKNRL